MGSGASHSESFISDQGTLGAQNAGRRPADRSGRDRRRASPASVSDRWRAVAGRHGWTPVGCQAGRPTRDGILVGSSSSCLSTGPCPRLMGPFKRPPTRSDLHGNRRQSRFGIWHDGNARYQCYQQDTNTPNDDQLVLASASGASQSTSKRLVLLTSTPHALKLLPTRGG